MPKPRQQPMFPTGEDLPLFSGTPARAQGEVFSPTPILATQGAFFSCPVCRDTGTYDGHRCWCEASAPITQED